jgi:hypothetical protein
MMVLLTHSNSVGCSQDDTPSSELFPIGCLVLSGRRSDKYLQEAQEQNQETKSILLLKFGANVVYNAPTDC